MKAVKHKAADGIGGTADIIRGFLFFFFFVCPILQGASFHIRFDAAVRSAPATGRLVIYLLKDDASKSDHPQPAGEYLFTNPQPIYGVDVKNLPPGQAMIINDSATSFPVELSKLPSGGYFAQAVLRLNPISGNWRHEPGNLYSDTIHFNNQPQRAPIEISLNHPVQPRAIPHMPGVEIIDVRSKLLSDFRHADFHMHAGVIWPLNIQPGRDYPVVYVVPGFGGDHFDAFSRKEALDKLPADSPERELFNNCFCIVLDPDGPNGHTLFADSDVNGPCGQALISEFIPALEAQLPLSRHAAGRIIYGHSSGGWSSLWLALTYPNVFGACWSYSPDPVDFHRLERVNIYDTDNAYIDRDSAPGHIFDSPSFRIGDKTICTVRVENLMEQAVGPDNSSAGQWDSWQSVWGHRDAAGNAAPLYDPITGKINHAEADYYKRRDITELLRQNPERYGQLLQQRVRLIVGDSDEFFLNEAVGFLKVTLEALHIQTPADQHHGYIHIIPGAAHGSIMDTPEALNFFNEASNFLAPNYPWIKK